MSPFPYRRLVAWVARRHREILFASAALFLLSGLSLFRLHFDMDMLAQLPSRKAFRDYRVYLRGFGAFDNLILLVSGPRAEIVPFSDALAAELTKVPEIVTVRHRVDLDSVRKRFLGPYREQLLPEEDAAELARRLEPAAIDERVRGLKRALAAPMSFGSREWIAGDPLGIDELVGRSFERRYADALVRPSGEYFLSRGGDSLVMIVRPRASAFDTIFSARLLDHVRATERKLLDGEWRGRSIEIGHTGSYEYAVADKRVMQLDLGIYFVVAPLAVLAIFHLGLRTLRILPFVTLPLLLTTIVTFAISLLCYGSLTMISVAFAGIFYGLGIDSSIYFYHLLRQKASTLGQLDAAKIELAVTEALTEVGAANVVASTTTAIAFLVVGMSDFVGVSQLGMMTAIAMMLNIVATFILLPAMVFVWGPTAIPQAAGESRVADFAMRFAEWIVARRSGVAVTAAALVLAVALAGIPRLALDTDFAHLRMGGGEAERVERKLFSDFGFVDAQGIVIAEAADAEAALETTERVAAALARYRDEGLVQSISSLTTFFPSRKTAGERLARFRALPRAEAARELEKALDREGFDVRAFRGAIDALVGEDRRILSIDEQRDGPLGGLIEHHFRSDAEGAALATYFVAAPGVPLEALRARLSGDLPDVPFLFTGRPLVEREFASLLRGELVWFLAGSLVLNLGIVLFAERRLASALALLSPTLAGLALYLGIMGLLGVAVDPINLIVLPLLIGLGVDDAVYLTAHTRHAGSVADGMRRGAVPLFLAVATTVVGFGSLGLARYPALSRLGWLAALGLSLCVLAALVAVPLCARMLSVPTSSRRAQEIPSK